MSTVDLVGGNKTINLGATPDLRSMSKGWWVWPCPWAGEYNAGLLTPQSWSGAKLTLICLSQATLLGTWDYARSLA